MAKRGVSFLIPNEYGRYILDILEPVDCEIYDWSVGAGQILRLNSVGIVDEELFNEHETRLSGQALNARIAQEPYYTIFADLKGFPRGEPISDIETYEDFWRSHCEILLLI